MWLDDFLYTSMILCVGAACQFAVVMWYMQKQKARAVNHKSLVAAKKVVQDMWQQAKTDDISLWEVLQRYRCVEVTAEEIRQLQEEDKAEAMGSGRSRAMPKGAWGSMSKKSKILADHADLNKRLLKASEHAVRNDVQETELTVLRYAHAIFSRFDNDGSGTLGPDEVRRAFTFFDIYKSTEQMATIMCMFLRDQGMWSPANEIEVRMKFSQFTFLLISIDSFELASDFTGNFTHRCISWFQSLSPSAMIDTLSRIFFPILMTLQVLIFYAILPLYPS